MKISFSLICLLICSYEWNRKERNYSGPRRTLALPAGRGADMNAIHQACHGRSLRTADPELKPCSSQPPVQAPL